MALKLLIFLVPLLINASCALAEMKIYCTPEDEVTPKNNDGDKKDISNPKGDGGGAAPKGGGDGKDSPDPKGGGGDGKDSSETKGGGGDGKDSPDPKGGGGDGKDSSETKGGGGDGKDSPDPKGGGGDDKDSSETKGGGGDGKDSPDPKGGGGDGKDSSETKGGGGDGKDSPDPKGGGGDGKDSSETKGGGGDGKDSSETKGGGGDGKDSPDPKGGGGDGKDSSETKGGGGDGKDSSETKGGGGDGKDSPDPKGGGGDGKDSSETKGGGGDGKDSPDPKGGGGDGKDSSETKGGGGDGKDSPDPKGGGGDGKDSSETKGGGGDGKDSSETKGGGGDGKDSPDPKGGGGDGKDSSETKGGGGDGKDSSETKGGGGDGKDSPDPKGGGGDGKDSSETKGGGGDGKDSSETKGGGGDGKDSPDPKGGGSGGADPKCGGDGMKIYCTPEDEVTPKNKDGDKKDISNPKGGDGDGKDSPDPKGGGGDGKDSPDPKGGGGGGADPKCGGDGMKIYCTPEDEVTPEKKDSDKTNISNPKGDGGGDGKDCPDPKGTEYHSAAPKGGDNGKDCPDPKDEGGDGKGAHGGGATPKGSGDGKDFPDPKGGDRGGDKKDGGGRKEGPNRKGGSDGKKKDGGDKNKDGATPFYKQPILESDYKGDWIVHNPNVGVCAMQYQLMPNNKAVWFDTTNLGPSALELGPKGNCPPNPDNNNEPDCFAHAVQYDVETGDVKTVYIETDPWCSSGHILPSGDLLSTGGNRMGQKAVRLLKKDELAPTFLDRKNALGASHWYASNLILEDGSAAIIGGRESFTYDIVPPTASVEFKPNNKELPFLKKTTTPKLGPKLPVENNLYPFVYLLPDGNVFIFANDRAISFNPQTGKTVKEYPVLKGGSRNYPPSGQSAILPLRLTTDNKSVTVEVVVCGGNKADAFQNVDPRYTQNRVFAPGFSDCNRIIATADNPTWQKEQPMPSPRVMGDLLQLPNGQFLLINGAKKGTSGWDDGEDPNFTPTVYMPENPMGKRFKELKRTKIPRMYHSVSSVLPDGKILVAGSNCHEYYTYDGPYPTELRVEKFSPHYLDPKFEKDKPVITADTTDKMLKYGKIFKVAFTVASNPNLTDGDVILTLLKPPFTTHGFSQNQRMLICAILKLDKNVITAVAPASGKLAPPGYYIMYVNHRNIPSKGVWVQIGS